MFLARLAAIALLLAHTASSDATPWSAALGDERLRASFERQVQRQLDAAPTLDHMTDQAHACAAFANAYQLSHDVSYLNAASRIAAFLSSNANLASDGAPGWGPRLDKGYGFCPDAPDFKSKNLWDTTRALDCLLKVAEIDKAAAPRYVALARQVVDAWPSVERKLDDGPYAKAGMRFYAKGTQACARRYVKNTNLAMGEVLHRLAAATGEPRYRAYGDQVTNAELWEIRTRKNFGYHGAMIYVEPADPQNRVTLQKEQSKVEREGERIVCRRARPDPSCWNHLGFEAYALYQVQLLSGRELGEAIEEIMNVYRSSPLGDTQRFDWSASSPTHVTAYNCYLRKLRDPRYREECARALAHEPSSAMILYGLVPDWLVPRK